MKYETPELKLIGNAVDVVQGVENLGGDILGQYDFG